MFEADPQPSAGIPRHVCPDGNGRDPVLQPLVFIAAHFLRSQGATKRFI